MKRQRTSSATTSYLSWRGKAGYASGDLGINVFWQAISLFLFFFYTDVMHLSPWWAGFTILIASVWDGFSDVLIGGLADRTDTRFGRYRPYLLFAAPLLGLVFVATFYVPSLASETLLIAYALTTHLLLRTAYTLVAIPYSSLSVRLTADSDERSSLAAWRMQAAATGGLTTALLTPAIVAHFATRFPEQGSMSWTYAAMLLASVGTACIWLCFLVTREVRLTTIRQTSPGVIDDFSAALRMLRRNNPLLRVFLCIIAASLCLSMMSKTLLYWFKYAVGNEAAAGVALATSASVLVLVAPAWAAIARRWSKRNAWRVGCLIAAAGYLLFLLLPMRSPITIYLNLAFIALGTASFAVMFWAMLPDTVEYDQWLSGERHEAKVFGFASFAQKLALGANAFLLGVLLDLIGFVPDVQQSDETLLGLKAIMTLVPMAGALFTLWVLHGYPIDAAMHRRITNELSSRDIDPKSGGTPHA